jgi:cell division protein FtsB
MIKLNETEEIVEHVTLGLAGIKDRTSRVESDVAGLRAAMAHGSAKVEKVRQEVARLKAELSVCWPKVNQDLTNLEQELAKLKEEIRTLNPKPELIVRRRPVQLFRLPPRQLPARQSLSSSVSQNVAAPRPKLAPVEVSAEFNFLKTSDLLQRLTPARTQSSRLLLRLPMTLSIRFASTEKTCRDRLKPQRQVNV